MVLRRPEIGEAARDLFANAQKLLTRLVDEKLLTARGVYGFWPAGSQGDAYDREARKLLDGHHQSPSSGPTGRCPSSGS